MKKLRNLVEKNNMNIISSYPDFCVVNIEMEAELDAFFKKELWGISEFSFPNLFFDSTKYSYQVSRFSEKTIIISGIDPIRKNDLNKNLSFFSIVGEIPLKDVVQELFDHFDYWKNVPLEYKEWYENNLSQNNFRFIEDRDNFDYLYFREDLANLSGKALHKKKNLVNFFMNNYSVQVKPLDIYTIEDARAILLSWKNTRSSDLSSDFEECSLALDFFEQLHLNGIIVYADGSPVGFSLGEFLQENRMFVVLFEKGISSYKGVYQFTNCSQARSLSSSVKLINREQDLGDEGLRQAKMTYRPCDFVRKHLIVPAEYSFN